MKAFLLIRTNPRNTSEILRKISQYNFVNEVDMVTGPYDLIAAIESQTTDDLLDLITREIRYIDGVTDTITCFVIPQKPKQ